MRLLFVTTTWTFPSPRDYNAGPFMRDFMQSLVEAGQDVKVIALQQYVPPPLLWMTRYRWARRHPSTCMKYGFPVIFARYMTLGGQRMWSAKIRHMIQRGATAAEKVLNEWSADRVVGFGLVESAAVAAQLKEQHKIPGVGIAIGGDVHTVANQLPKARELICQTVSALDLVLPVSRELTGRLRKLCGNRGRIVAFHRGIDMSKLSGLGSREELRSELGLVEDGFYVCYLGHLTPAKGINDLMHAFSSFAKRRKSARLLLIGGGALSATERQKSERAGLGQKVTITGRVPRMVALSYVKASDMFVFPSHVEGLPNAVQEALACEVPIVATDVGGIPEIVVHGKHGNLVPARDPEGLLRAMSDLASDMGGARRMATEGKKRVLRDFDMRKNVRKFCELLEELETGSRHAARSGCPEDGGCERE